MAKVASEKEYNNLQDDHIESIVKVLKSFKYSDKDFEDNICPPLVQWLHDNLVTIESTCVIISSIIDIGKIQKLIDEIYNPNTLLPPFALSKLRKFLSKEDFDRLESVIMVKELKGVIEDWIDNTTSIQTNFTDKCVHHIVHRRTKDNKPDNKISYAINAVPTELIVYDNPTTDLPRSFKITFESMSSNRKWTIDSEYGGASIKEISQQLINAGYCPSPKLVESAVTCMINSMIQEDMAIIKTDIDNLGVYYTPTEEAVSVVDLDYDEPSDEDKYDAIDVLSDVHYFYTDNEAVFATVFKWGLMSVFSYSMKLAGNKLPWLYLKGTSQSGKTTVSKIILYLYGVPQKNKNNLGGGSFDSPYKIGVNLSQDCTMRVVNEPAGVFDSQSNREIIKNAVDNTVARSKQQGGGFRHTSAFSPVVFTANDTVPDDDALINRFYILSFYYAQRKTDEQKEDFKEAFHIDIPSKSPLVDLNIFGKFAIREIISEPQLLEDDWQKVADLLLERFYSSVDMSVPEWLCLWESSESINEFDESVREDIRTFFLDEINRIRRRGLIRDEYGNIKTTLDTSEVSSIEDFESEVWDMINTNVFNWCIPHRDRDDDKYLCLTQTFRKELKKQNDFNDNLKSIAQILQWEYANVRFSNGSQKRCIKVSLDKFLEFVYPRVEL